MKAELELKSDQLSNVSYRLDSLLALNEKNAKENPDAERIKELEGRMALHMDASATHKAEMGLLKGDHEEQLSKVTVELKVKTRELEASQEEAKVANERAFAAESRLGREQALSRDLMAQLNQLRVESASSSVSAANSSTNIKLNTPISAAAAKPVARTELDDLSLDDLDFVEPASTVTQAEVVSPKSKSKSNSSSKPKGKDWGEIDALLGDIQSVGKK